MYCIYTLPKRSVAHHCIESRRIFRTPTSPRSTGSRPLKARASHRRGHGVVVLYHTRYCIVPTNSKYSSHHGLEWNKNTFQSFLMSLRKHIPILLTFWGTISKVYQLKMDSISLSPNYGNDKHREDLFHIKPLCSIWPTVLKKYT